MARNRLLKLVKVTGKLWDVVDRETGHHYARLYKQGYGGFKFKLDNYPQNLSRAYPSEALALEAIEREVF